MAHGLSETAKKAMINGGYFQYITLGAEHMITGYDHLLFLLGVVFFLNKFDEIIKFVSAFTIGHSITLTGATFLGITANYWLVDAVIAITVCYKGFDNNGGFHSYFKMKRAPNIVAMVFIFGLIHGFGLSTRLQQLPLGDTSWSMFMRIISFNIGVEIGQIAALAAMVPILAVLRRRQSFQQFSRITNDGLVIAGLLLFLMQMHGFLHNHYPDEFGFSEDNHQHAHDNMEEVDNHHDNL